MDKETLLSLGRPQRKCMNCDGALDQIERHPSALRGDRRRLERLDYCPECWERVKDEVFDSFWMVRRQTGPRRAPKLNRRQRSIALRALFESLWDRREQEDVAPELYLLAHLLMKWGGLRWRENVLDITGRPCVIFEDAASGDRVEIPEIELEDERLAAIQQRIEEFLAEHAQEGEEVEL